MKNIQAIFLDRDGTIIEDKHYLSNPKEVELLPFVGQTLKKLHDRGMQIFIVTNQSGIGRGYFPERDFHACQKELYRQLDAFGVTVTDMTFCPHDPSKLYHSEFECVEMCDCRKPNIGMWHQLEEKYHLHADRCVMIGDKKEDLGFGIHAGFAGACLVPTGKGLKSAKELGLQNLEKTGIIEFSSQIVKDVLPCGFTTDTVNQSACDTKCFSLSSFEKLLDLLSH